MQMEEAAKEFLKDMEIRGYPAYKQYPINSQRSGKFLENYLLGCDRYAFYRKGLSETLPFRQPENAENDRRTGL